MDKTKRETIDLAMGDVYRIAQSISRVVIESLKKNWLFDEAKLKRTRAEIVFLSASMAEAIEKIGIELGENS